MRRQWLLADEGPQAEIEPLGQTAMNRFGRIGVWLNDARVGAIGRFDEIPPADYVQVIETNLLGTLYGSYFALRLFRR